MTWVPRREPSIVFPSWRTMLYEWGLVDLHDENGDPILYGADAWAFSATIHLQSLVATVGGTTIQFRMRLFLLWQVLRSDRRKLRIAEQVAQDLINDKLTSNQARETLGTEGLWPETLSEAGLVEQIPQEISQIEDDAVFHVALTSYRKNRL